MKMDGKDLKGKNEGQKPEEQLTDAQKAEEQAVEERIREMADDVEIPESLKPGNIEKI